MVIDLESLFETATPVGAATSVSYETEVEYAEGANELTAATLIT